MYIDLFFSIAFCQNERVFTVGFDGKAQVHDLETAKSIVDLCGHECAINHCSAHPTQPNLVTTSCKDGSIRVWVDLAFKNGRLTRI